MRKNLYWAVGFLVVSLILEILFFFLRELNLSGFSELARDIIYGGVVALRILAILFQLFSALLFLWFIFRAIPHVLSFVRRTFLKGREKVATFKKQQASKGAYNELMKSKALLDAGAITEEEHSEKAKALKSSIQ